MPDFNDRATEGARDGWSDAFAALPMETPPADGWTRITRALDGPALRRGAMRREHRMSWVIGLASAAGLAFVAWSPLSHWLQHEAGAVRPTLVATEAPGVRGPAAPLRNEAVATELAIKPDVDKVQVASSDAAAPKPVHRKSARSKRAVARQPRLESAAVSATASVASTTAANLRPSAAAMTRVDADPLQKLKTQSAQLEALVALARDERVANASSELLSSELDSGIAAVDAALSQPDIASTRRQELWQQRVDLLQQLAGVEATSRWLAAQGASNDTALVSVY